MAVPPTLGDLVLRERLGEGGYGTVYRAEQPALGRDAVVKVLHARVEPGPAADRFLAEVRLAARLDHPYAAHVYDFGVEADGLAWVAMERVRGTPLDRMLAAGGPLPPERLLPLVDRLCEVVQSAHEQGIVHRDLKPANVMVLSRAGRLLPKLLDLGVARGEGDGATAGEAARQGTPLYMAPEQWTAPASVDGRADIYALGVLVYECLTGRPPFEGASWFALARAHARKPPPPLGPAFPAALDAVVARALAKQPGARFATAGELALALRSAAGLVDERTRPPRLPEELRAAWTTRAPQPLAEALAALDAAGNPHQAALAARTLVSAACRWVGLLALAATGRAGSRIPARARELTRRSVDDAEWLALARDACAGFRSHAEAHPLPELVALDEADPPVIDIDAPTEEELRSRLADQLGGVAAFLGRLGWLLDYRLVVRRGERVESWTGLRRAPRETVEMAPAAAARLPTDRPVILDAEAAPALLLAPLVSVAPPAPGAADEVFMLAGPGRSGARLLAVPAGFERQDDEPWSWLRARLDASEAQDGASPTAEERAPYLGLAPFTAAEAELYVGREAEAQAFVNRLRVAPLLAVVGPSGAGKSSFVHAGVVPILPEGWRVATLRPGTDPWVSLTSRGEADLHVVDQLEELLTLGASAEEQERFAVRLAAAPRVVVTLRDDFLMRARELPALGDRLAQGLVLLSTPGEADLGRMVSEPARRAGYDFDDPDLPGEMARAVAGRPGALALLSFTAARLWEQRDRAFRRLSRRAYDAMGGVAGALATHAEQTLAELPPGERALVRQAFRRLVTVEGTRAVVARAELEQALGPRAGNVIERLVEARLLVATESEGGAEHIEIIHEALLEAWPRLAAWRREDESGARLRAQLGSAARQWHERGRARGLLWRDEALTELQRWRRAGGEPLTTVEQDFAGASLAEAARGRRRRTLALAVILAALGAGIAVLAWMNTRTEEQRREAQARLAQLHEEQGRQAVLAAQPGQALAYLAEAQRLGRASAAGRYLVAESLRMMDAQVAELRGHKGTIWSIAFSRDGNRLVTAGDDGTARIFDTTGRALAVLRHEGPVWRASFSPDGTRVATASHDGTAGIWDAATGARRLTLRHAARVTTAHWSPDGNRLVTASRDGTAGIWDTTTGARLASLGGEGGTAVLISRFSPDGNRLVTATADGALQLWTAGGERLARVEAHAGFGILYLGFSPDGRRIATGCDDGSAAIWEAADLAPVARLVGHLERVWTVDIAPDGDTVVTASADRSVKIWRLERPAQPLTSLAHPGVVDWAAISPDGALIATAGGDGVTRIFTITGTLLAELGGHRDQVRQVVFDPGNRLVAAAAYDGSAKVWHARPRHLLWEQHLFAHRPGVARFSPDGRALASAGMGDRTVRIWDAERGVELESLVGTEPSIFPVWSRDGARLLRDAGSVLEIVDRRGAVATRLAGPPGRIYGAAFLSGDRVVSVAEEGSHLWDVRSGRELAILPPAFCVEPTPAGQLLTCALDGSIGILSGDGIPVGSIASGTLSLGALALDEPGERVLAAGDDTVVKYWSLADRRLLLTLEGHTSSVYDVDIAPGGKLAATAGNDRTVRIWDLETGKTLKLLEHGGPAFSVQFSPDGRRLATVSADRTLRVWDVTPDERSPADLLDLVACRVPFRVEGGQAVHFSVSPERCPGRL